MPGIDIMSSTAVRKDPICLHLCVNRGHSCIESVDLIEMKAQQEAMVLRYAAAKRLTELFM